MEIEVSGQCITVESSYPVLTVRTGNGYELQSEAAVKIVAADGTSWFGNVEDSDIASSPLWSSIQGVIESAVASVDGKMRIRFRSGASIELHPDAVYESWSVTGPGGFRVVCTPGGELAIWSAR